MIIGVCGYTSTGSSAVSDYLKEYSDVSVLDNLEFTVTHHPDGLEDLDYHLNEKISKFTSSTVAIKRFRRCMHTLLYKEMGSQIDEITDRFVEKICQAKWYGYASNDFVLYNNWIYKNVCMRIIRGHIFEPLAKRFDIYPNVFPAREMEYSCMPEGFEEAAKSFIEEILVALGADLSKNVILDQPFAGNDPFRSFKYYKNPIAIVVDRDPRDNYIFAKEVLKARGRQIPTNTVEDFIAYYKNMRKLEINETDQLIKIQFEDMVYEYEKTTKRLIEFLSLNEKNHSKKLFVPEQSKHNTYLFNKFKKYSDDVKAIEEALPEYLYDFSKHKEQLPSTEGKMFYGRSPLNK